LGSRDANASDCAKGREGLIDRSKRILRPMALGQIGQGIWGDGANRPAPQLLLRSRERRRSTPLRRVEASLSAGRVHPSDGRRRIALREQEDGRRWAQLLSLAAFLGFPGAAVLLARAERTESGKRRCAARDETFRANVRRRRARCGQLLAASPVGPAGRAGPPGDAEAKVAHSAEALASAWGGPRPPGKVLTTGPHCPRWTALAELAGLWRTAPSGGSPRRC